MNNNSKLQNLIEKIKSKYMDELYYYVYVGPDDRSFLRKGHFIKYIDITDNEYKIKSGIIVELTLDKLTLKSIGTNFFWKIKYTQNHIFFYEQSNKLKMFTEALEFMNNKKTKKKKKNTTINTNTNE
jgi:hypothetical protein